MALSIEVGYKHLKSRAEPENWTGISTCAVEQDFYCKHLNADSAAILAYIANPIPETIEVIALPQDNGCE